MNLEIIREYCLSLPGASEMIQWETALLFKIGGNEAGKIFAVFSMSETAVNLLSLKCNEERFVELTEEEGIIQAPHFARGKWICLQKNNRLKVNDLKKLIKESYDLVFTGLTKKMQQEIKEI